MINLATFMASAALVLTWRRSHPNLAFNTLEAEQAADDDSRFIDVHGLRVHAKIAGDGAPALMLLHGFAASTFTWNQVFPRLAELGTVIDFDRPAHGLTARPIEGEWNGPNPYTIEAQADLTIDLLEQHGIARAILIGHSAGGTVATLTALRHPARISALVLVAPVIYANLPPPTWLRPALERQTVRRIAPAIVRAVARATNPIIDRAWHDPAAIAPATREGYARPFRITNWDRAMTELARANRPLELKRHINTLEMPVLVISGDDDHIVPLRHTRRLAAEIPQATLKVIPDCGHIPQEEKPDAFLSAVIPFITA